jgi:hypothetical protein
MIATARPFTRSRRSHMPLVSTAAASQTLRVPGRTVRRWVQQRGLGMMVAGRRVLTADDVRLLKMMRDGAIS